MTDVVIAGAGITGATLALALERGGLETVLIDPQPFSVQLAETFDGRASAISFAAFRQWRALGVAERLEAVAQPINQILVTEGRSPGAASGKAGSAFLRFDAREIADRSGGEPLGYLIENRHIRAALAAQIEAMGIEVLSPAEVGAVEQGGVARVTLVDGRELSAALIVGADGRNSRSRREAGIDVTGWSYPQVGVVATVELARDHDGVAYEHFLPSGPFAVLPLTGGRASLVWTESTARARRSRLRGTRCRLARETTIRRLPRRRDAGWTALHLPAWVADGRQTHRTARRPGRRRGHSVHPIAGQGVNMGLKDVAALAEVLTDAARLAKIWVRRWFWSAMRGGAASTIWP